VIIDYRVYLTVAALCYAVNVASLALPDPWRSRFWAGAIATLGLTVLVAYLDWLWS
jgi:hypothetical protein